LRNNWRLLAPRVVIADIDFEKAQHVASSFGGDGQKIEAVALDVKQAADFESTVTPLSEHGRLTTLHNAGVAVRGKEFPICHLDISGRAGCECDGRCSRSMAA